MRQFKSFIFQLLFIVFCGLFSFAQNTDQNQDTIPFLKFGTISTKFTKSSFELKKGSIVSNVLKVVNNDRKTINFQVDLLFPGGWSRIDDPNKIYSVKPKDTVIVPIIISPTKLINGNTEIAISAFILDINGRQLGNNSFNLTTKKRVAWKLDLINNTNFYFKNEEKEIDFSFSVINDGNYDQDLFINYTIPKKDLIIADTLSNPIKDPSKTFTLKPGETRVFNEKVVATSYNETNKIRLPINTYIPSRNRDRITRNLIINSSEPRVSKTDLQKRTKVNFVKLPNEQEVSPYGYPNLPLIMDLNAQNVLDDRSFYH